MVQTHPHRQHHILTATSRSRRARAGLPTAKRVHAFGSRDAKTARRMPADEPAWGRSTEERLLQQLRQLASVFPGSRLIQD